MRLPFLQATAERLNLQLSRGSYAISHHLPASPRLAQSLLRLIELFPNGGASVLLGSELSIMSMPARRGLDRGRSLIWKTGAKSSQATLSAWAAEPKYDTGAPLCWSVEVEQRDKIGFETPTLTQADYDYNGRMKKSVRDHGPVTEGYFSLLEVQDHLARHLTANFGDTDRYREVYVNYDYDTHHYVRELHHVTLPIVVTTRMGYGTKIPALY